MNSEKENELKLAFKEKILKRIPEFCLMDDTYMTAFFNDQPELIEFVLSIILERDDLKVVSSETQKPLKNIQGRSIILDVYAVDRQGKEYNIEIQNSSANANPKRARYYSSMLDSNAILPKDDFKKLPETYVIFFTQQDYFKRGLPLYTIERSIKELDNSSFGDEQHIIYINGRFKGDSPIGKLIHDFNCANPRQMHYDKLAERSIDLKETSEGDGSMCKIMQELNEEYAKLYAKLHDKETAKNLLQLDVPIEKIVIATGLSLEEVTKLAEEIKKEN